MNTPRHYPKQALRMFVCFACLSVSLAESARKPQIDFNRDIRPIFSENCYACHGPDHNKRKAGLRLDKKEDAFKQLESGNYAIVPGDLAKSKLIYRITTSDDDDRMPPHKTGKHLTRDQIEKLRRWVAQGAEWKGHWAYLKPERPLVPLVRNKRWLRNEIDAFILARLEKEGLSPSREADKTTLLRRVTFDLTGLPPTIGEIDAFLADRRLDAYERVVDRLLASPAFGERLAEFWLDLARYADTNGYHIDNHRDMWLWREWVIKAFNQNMPFDEFTVEQIAGDLLPDATLEQKVASGFNRNNMVNFEGGADPDEYMSKYIVDRVDTTAAVWLGSTLGCAECHDHKYDPFTQKEFYQMYAFFNHVPEKGLDGQKSNPVPSLPVPSPDQAARMAKLKESIRQTEAELKQRLDEKNPALDASQVAWERTLTHAVIQEWTPAEPVEFSSEQGARLNKLEDNSILVSGDNPDKDTYRILLKTPLENITGFRLEALTHDQLPLKSSARSENGNFVLTGLELEAERAALHTPEPEPEPAVLGTWRVLGPFIASDAKAGFGRQFIDEPKVDLDKTYVDGTLRWTEKPDWKDGEVQKLTGELAATYLYRTITVKAPRLMMLSLGSDDGIQVWLNGQKILSHEIARAAEPDQEKLVLPLMSGENKLLLKINNEGGEFAYYFKAEEKPLTKYNVSFAAALADFSQKDFEVSGVLKNDPKTGWAIAGYEAENRTNRQAIFIPRQPFGFPGGTTLRVALKFASEFKQHAIGRFRLALATSDKLTELSQIPANIQRILFQPSEHRSDTQNSELTKYYRGRFVPEIVEFDKHLFSLREAEQKLEQSVPQTMVMEEMEKPRDTFILLRGNFQNKGEKVTPNVPAALPPLPPGEPHDRLGLAHWLVSPEQPLTSRVTVNRFWQMFFGVGLVKTGNDFGSQGEWPSHPELLDWLACEFMGSSASSQSSSTHWNVKQLLKLIVTSSTYRQSAIITPQLLERDRDNRLLAHGPRFRMDAEMIRDGALAVSGLLDHRIGGESVRPYQPPGLWEAMAFGGEFSSQTYVQSHGPDLYRRGIYVYWKRSMPYPPLITFDAPSREVCTVQRPRTTTPLQALVLMNDPAFVEAARGLAQRVLLEGGPTLEEKLNYAFRLTLARKPSREELDDLRTIYEQQLANFARDKKAAADLVSVGESAKPKELDPSELAAWIAIGNILLNLDETITKG